MGGTRQPVMVGDGWIINDGVTYVESPAIHHVLTLKSLKSLSDQKRLSPRRKTVSISVTRGRLKLLVFPINAVATCIDRYQIAVYILLCN